MIFYFILENSYFSSSSTSYCILQYASGLSISHNCTITNENSLTFGYIINTYQTIPAGKFELSHYGIDSNNMDGSDTSFNVILFSKETYDEGYVIDQTITTGPIVYLNSGSISPSLTLTATFNNYNYLSKTYFDLGFQINQRGLYKTEYINLDLSKLESDNLNNRDYKCIMLYSNKEKSSDFMSVSFASFEQVLIKPKKDILTFTQAYYLRCYHIIIPYAGLDQKGQFNISGFVATSENTPIISRVSFTVKTFNYSTVFNYFELEFTQKLLSSPGNNQDMMFSLVSRSFNLTNSSRIIVWFPYYYPSLLNLDGKIFCQINGMVKNIFFLIIFFFLKKNIFF